MTMSKKALKGQALQLGILSKVVDGNGRPYRNIDNVPMRVIVDFVEQEPLRIKAEADRKARVQAEIDAAFAQRASETPAEYAARIEAANQALAAHDQAEAEERKASEERANKAASARASEYLKGTDTVQFVSQTGTMADLVRKAVGADNIVRLPRGGKKIGAAVVRDPKGRFGPGVVRQITARDEKAAAAK